MREVLSEADRERLDEREDTAFYAQPRFVTHVDDAFRDRLTALYAELLSPGDRVFDATSSWISHLPDVELAEVVGHGLNGEELAANDRLDRWFVRDLNANPSLPLPEDAFDAVCCAVSVQYLTRPAAVFREFARVLAPGGVLVVSFSNRMFPTKAVRAWREADTDGRAELVESYAHAAALERTTVVHDGHEADGRDPFTAVVARPV